MGKLMGNFPAQMKKVMGPLSKMDTSYVAQ